MPCQTPEFSQTVYGEPWTCDYTLDVTGGWYDAGDHGKYVVNGGISVAQLMTTWERNQNARDTDGGRSVTARCRVPERGNGVPDVLDEARWELEWMLTMQVPAGEPLAGMVHHKVHDNQWTGLPLDPAADDKMRELHRPSTAATSTSPPWRRRARACSSGTTGRSRASCSKAARAPGRRPTPTRRSTPRPPTATPAAARTTTRT